MNAALYPHITTQGRIKFRAISTFWQIPLQKESLHQRYVNLFKEANAVDCALCFQRIFDNAWTATNVPLSDHYGVKVTLKDVRSNCKEFQNNCPPPPSYPSFVLWPSLKKLCVAAEWHWKLFPWTSLRSLVVLSIHCVAKWNGFCVFKLFTDKKPMQRFAGWLRESQNSRSSSLHGFLYSETSVSSHPWMEQPPP